MAYMVYMDLAVCSPRKAPKRNHFLTHLDDLMQNRHLLGFTWLCIGWHWMIIFQRSFHCSGTFCFDGSLLIWKLILVDSFMFLPYWHYWLINGFFVAHSHLLQNRLYAKKVHCHHHECSFGTQDAPKIEESLWVVILKLCKIRDPEKINASISDFVIISLHIDEMAFILK